MHNPIHLHVPKTATGRRFAISDVHACSKTFKALLNQIDLQKEDQLFLVGDMVNRGPNSHKVLNRIIKLKKKGYQLYFLRGNHEQMVLNNIRKSNAQRKRSLQGGNSQKLLKNNHLRERYRILLEESIHYIDTGDFFIVHAGFNSTLEKPFEHEYSMLNIRNFKMKKEHLGERKLIIGHQPKALSEIRERIQKGKRKIYIDNGCVSPQFPGQGNLIALNLDTMEITVQENLDTDI